MNAHSKSFAVALRFTGELTPYKARMVGVALLSVFGAVIGIIRPWPIQWIVDGALMPTGAIDHAPKTVVWTGVGAALIFAIAQALTQYGSDMQIAQVGHRVTRGLRYRIFAHLSKLSPRFFARHKSGDLLVRLMGDAPVVSTMLVDSSIQVASRVLLIVGTVAVMFAMDWQLTAGLVLALPTILIVVRWIAGKITIAVRKQRRKEGELADYLHEAIAAAPVIQSLGSEDHVVRRFARNNRRSERAGLKAKRLAARMSVAVESLLGLAFAGALFFGSLRVLADQGDPTGLTAGKLLVYLSYVRSLAKPIRAASKHADRFAKGAACGERLLAVLDVAPEVQDAPDARPLEGRPMTLGFDGVGYTYDGSRPAVHDVSVEFRAGELALLRGRNGAGKSTLAALAMRLMDPDEGEVQLDGSSAKLYTVQSVREAVGLALQHDVLFGDSLRENLLVARPEATDEELITACRDAGFDTVLDELEDGLETRLGAAGVGLSGGQRHRLALARTLLRGTQVLIVDEPFAGLDVEAAQGVAETLARLASDRVVIVIAHDAPDAAVFERIVTIDDGAIVGDERTDAKATAPVTEVRA